MRQYSFLLLCSLASSLLLSACIGTDMTARANKESREAICDVFENGERENVRPTSTLYDAPDVSKEGVRFEVQLGGTSIEESFFLSYQKQEENTLLLYAVNKQIDLNGESEFDAVSTDTSAFNPRGYGCDVGYSSVANPGAGQVWLATYGSPPESEFVREDYALVVMEVERDAIDDWQRLE